MICEEPTPKLKQYGFSLSTVVLLYFTGGSPHDMDVTVHRHLKFGIICDIDHKYEESHFSLSGAEGAD